MLGEWQPIETAPKDGTVVLLADDGRVYAGWWRAGQYPWAFVDDTVNNTECPECEADLSESELIYPNGFHDQHPPTHWMPLPDPPQC